ncbi:hypothetical protein [Salipaludibacillus daqingensis]|uniref:hypothetical protein n=1 Tax=Salipaludibacillus daqingensis TaxID=3041001 RepID=UPI0024734C10|nr:hypothetical protein [Salipaludibacillus daqingensis]
MKKQVFNVLVFLLSFSIIFSTSFAYAGASTEGEIEEYLFELGLPTELVNGSSITMSKNNSSGRTLVFDTIDNGSYNIDYSVSNDLIFISKQDSDEFPMLIRYVDPNKPKEGEVPGPVPLPCDDPTGNFCEGALLIESDPLEDYEELYLSSGEPLSNVVQTVGSNSTGFIGAFYEYSGDDWLIWDGFATTTELELRYTDNTDVELVEFRNVVDRISDDVSTLTTITSQEIISLAAGIILGTAGYLTPAVLIAAGIYSYNVIDTLIDIGDRRLDANYWFLEARSKAFNDPLQ